MLGLDQKKEREREFKPKEENREEERKKREKGGRRREERKRNRKLSLESTRFWLFLVFSKVSASNLSFFIMPN